MSNFFIHYLEKSKEIYFKFYESPHKVEVKDKEDAVKYLQTFYQWELKRVEEFKKELDKFANNDN